MKRELEPEQATVSEKGQVTIPKRVRDRLGIRPGQHIAFRAEEGKLVGVKVMDDDPVGAVYGTLGKGRNTDDIINELRGEVLPGEVDPE